MVLLRRSAATANAQGVDCEPLTPKQAGEKYPIMRTDDLVGAVWLPGDGKANPADITQALARGARTGGVRIFEKTRVTAVDTKDGRVTGVQTTEGPITAEIVVNCARPMGAPARPHGRRHGAALFLRAHVHRHREDGERAARPAGDARSRRLHLFQGGGRRPADGRLRARGQALEQGHHPRRFRVRHAARRLGPVPDPDGQRADPRAGAGEDRHQDLHERPGELYAGPQLHPGRGAAAERLLRRRRLQLHGHRELGRRRHGAGRMDRGRRADARSLAGRHPPLRRLPRQRRLAARPRLRDARPALQDGVAAARAGERPAVPPLAALRPAEGARRLVRQQDGLGAAQLVRRRRQDARHAIWLGPRRVVRFSRRRAPRHARGRDGHRRDLVRQDPGAGSRCRDGAATARRQRRRRAGRAYGLHRAS